MNPGAIMERLNILPEMLQHQVTDYIEFLISRYQADTDNIEELSSEIKDLLDNRLAEYEENPNDVVSWQNVKNQFNKKHNYAI